ncbi:MAG: UPF0280 family protein [Deltaproteobacteria bacterium]|nr:UPF0280 family protein [Candidatus Tharpella sp.]
MSKGGVQPHPSSYRQRCYRQPQDFGGGSFEVRIEESDLWISGSGSDACSLAELESLACERLLFYRQSLNAFLQRYPDWGESLVPLADADFSPVPQLARQMMRAARVAGVGPMAAVAGALAQAVGQDLLDTSPELVVENGGDIFLAGRAEYTLSVFAGTSPLSGRLGFRLSASKPFSCGVCTSSGRVGHSLSFGRADAVTIVADNAAVADAAATAMANLVQRKADLASVVEKALVLEGVSGALAVIGDDLAVGGDLELIDMRKQNL